jgi:hypothetical protein
MILRYTFARLRARTVIPFHNITLYILCERTRLFRPLYDLAFARKEHDCFWNGRGARSLVRVRRLPGARRDATQRRSDAVRASANTNTHAQQRRSRARSRWLCVTLIPTPIPITVTITFTITFASLSEPGAGGSASRWFCMAVTPIPIPIPITFALRSEPGAGGSG